MYTDEQAAIRKSIRKGDSVSSQEIEQADEDALREGMQRSLATQPLLPENQAFATSVKSALGKQWLVLEQQPPAPLDRPAIWRSTSQPGTFGLNIPGVGSLRVNSLEQAKTTLSSYGAGSRLSNGENVRIKSIGLQPAERAALEQKHGIVIEPIKIDGKEIAYLFRGAGSEKGRNSTVLLSCHGDGKGQDAPFVKPDGIDLKFAAPSNTILSSSTKDFAQHLKDDQVTFHDPSQHYPLPSRPVTNYKLDGHIGTTSEEVADFIGDMNQNGGKKDFDFILLNRGAEGVSFADLLQGMEDSLGKNSHRKVIAHFCRPKNDNATVFDVKNNFRPPSLPVKSPPPTSTLDRVAQWYLKSIDALDRNVGGFKQWLIDDLSTFVDEWHSAHQMESPISRVDKSFNGNPPLDHAQATFGGPVIFPDVQPMGNEFRGEEAGRVFGTPVKYLNQQEREAYAITVGDDGRLYGADGKPVDTRNGGSAFGGRTGTAIFVMDHTGKVYLSNKRATGKFHHSSFGAGAPVAAAGEIVVHDGVLRSISRNSGHYKPTKAQLQQCVQNFVTQGVRPFTVHWDFNRT